AEQTADRIERLRQVAERLGEPDEHQVAERVPGELSRREAVLERGGPRTVATGERDETLAEIAGRRPAEIAAQPPRRPAVVGDADDRGGRPRVAPDRLEREREPVPA